MLSVLCIRCIFFSNVCTKQSVIVELCYILVQCESKKNSHPEDFFVAIFPKRLGIFQPNFTCLLCVPIYARLECKFLFNYLQLWRSYAKEVICSAAPGTAPLTASPPADRLQAGRSDTQDPCNIHTVLPQRSHQTSRNRTSTPFIHHAATSQTDYENTFRRQCFPMLCTLCLELVGLWNITL